MSTTIAELDGNNFEGLNQKLKDICTLELTVTTGLEEVAALECKEKLNLNPYTYRGRVVVDVPINTVLEVFKLRSIDNVSILIKAENFVFPPDREECFKKFYSLANEPDWKKGIEVWQIVFGKETGVEDIFKEEKVVEEGFVTPKPQVDLKLMKDDSSISGNLPKDVRDTLFKNKEGEQIELNGNSVVKDGVTTTEQRKSNGPKFRVSCHRVGQNHKFGSSEAARQFGGGINEKFGWPVDLSHYKLEVLLNIIGEFVYAAISLTREPLFKRNLTFFGPTNLRSTISYSLVKLAKPEPGDVVIDPMCGGSSIPIEGALSHPSCFHLGGDIFEAAVFRSKNNINHLIKEKKMSLCTNTVHWDSTALPLRDQSVDVVVCDLPFGKRSGSKADNRVLYFKALVELARVTRVETGRAVLLTHDKKTLTKSLRRLSSLWKNFSLRNINIGGLVGGIFLLERTRLFSDPSVTPDIHSDSSSKGEKRKFNVLIDENTKGDS